MSEKSDELGRMKAALELIWTIHVRKHVHLGLERYSGLEQRCIPCICALALGQSMDGFAEAEAFEKERELLRIEEDTHAAEETK